MAPRIEVELSVGLSLEHQQALTIATDLLGMKASTYARQAVVERLVRDGVLQSPMAKYQAATKADAK